MENKEKDISKFSPVLNDKIDLLEGFKINASTYMTEHLDYSGAIDFLSVQSGKLKTATDKLSAWSNLEESARISLDLPDIQKDFSSLSSIHSYLPKIDHLESIPSMISATRKATLSFSALADPSVLTKLSASIDGDFLKSGLYKPIANPLSGLAIKFDNKASHIWSEKLSSLALETGLLKATELSLFTEKSLYTITEDNLGSRITMATELKKCIKGSLSDFSDSYSTLIDSFDRNPVSYSQINPSILRNAPIEFFTTADLLEVISVDKNGTQIKEKLKDEIKLENETSLKSHLSKIDSRFYNMWIGAVEAFNSNNKDRVRHFCTSIRELLTHVLHTLAPDTAIKKWSTDTSHYYNGNPTRRARLLYICRDINHKPFNNFVEKDVESAIKFIEIFQKGTHSVEPDFSDNELLVIKSKAEGTLKFLLEIHFATNN